jgi:hypothetical protein
VVQTYGGSFEQPTVADAKAWARATLGARQYACLDAIAQAESRWDPLVWNRKGSGAYGIPQAKPASKMAAFGDDYLTDPMTQVHWMAWYVKERYGSACNAWATWLQQGWY